MTKYSITDLDLRGKRTFIRVDFNVPIKNGAITDDTRMTSSLPTIQYALDHGATVILASHLGRPKGKPTPEFSLKPVADHLAQLLKRDVVFASDCIGEPAKAAVAQAHAGSKVALLEKVERLARARDPRVVQVMAGVAAEYDVVLVARSDGVMGADVRPLVRLSVTTISVMACAVPATSRQMPSVSSIARPAAAIA